MKKTLTCLICSHKKVKEINKMILGGATLIKISARFGLAQSTVHRHKPHIAVAIERTELKRHLSVGDSLMDDMERIRFKLWCLCEQAEQQQDGAAQIVVLRELRATIESLDERFSRLKSAGKREIALRVVYDDSLSEEEGRLLGSRMHREEAASTPAEGETKRLMTQDVNPRTPVASPAPDERHAKPLEQPSPPG